MQINISKLAVHSYTKFISKYRTRFYFAIFLFNVLSVNKLATYNHNLPNHRNDLFL